ncbi:hypothetical protein ACMHYB_25585 [Sorangium sp. So ce1128]
MTSTAPSTRARASRLSRRGPTPEYGGDEPLALQGLDAGVEATGIEILEHQRAGIEAAGVELLEHQRAAAAAGSMSTRASAAPGVEAAGVELLEQ